MSANYKNQLQERFQKRKLPLPTYDTITNLSNKVPRFISRLTLFDGQVFIGEQTNRKIDAEQSAAEKALENMLEKSEEEEVSNVIKYNPLDFNSIHQPNTLTYILVDYENCNKIGDLELYIKDRKDIKMITTCAQGFGKKGDVNVVIRSSISDANDHYISFLIGQLISKTETMLNIIILTKDHFGSAIKDFVNLDNQTNFLSHPIKVYHATDQEDCVEFLKEIGYK